MKDWKQCYVWVVEETVMVACKSEANNISFA